MIFKKTLVGALSALMVLSAAVTPLAVDFSRIWTASADENGQELLTYRDDIVNIDYTLIGGRAAITNFRFRSTPEEYTIPELLDGHRVIELGENCFGSKKGITGVIVPKCIKYIRVGAFSNTDLKWIRFENPDVYFDNFNWLIPNSTSIIGYSGSDAEIYAYRNWRNFVAIDQQVTDGTFIGVDFNGQIRITGILDDTAESVVIPEEICGLPVTSIGRFAFIDNNVIKTLVIPDSVTEILQYAFSNCTALESIDFGSGLSFLGYGAFEDCSSLKEINLPESLQYISEFAFGNCTSLEKVTLPEYVNTISSKAFYASPWLDSLQNEEGLTILGPVLLDGHGFIGNELVIPDGVRYIGKDAFSGMDNITSLTMPEGVNNIGSNAFSNCTELERISLPDSLSDIESGAFSGCSALKYVEFGNNLKNIFSSVFNECSSLTDIILPETVELIGYSSFAKCTSLRSINIPASVSSIESSAFSGCTALTDIDFSMFEQADIGMNAFYNVPWLEAEKEKSEMVIVGKVLLDATQCSGDVTIPEGVEGIAGYAFMGSGITSVEFQNSAVNFSFGAFSSCRELTEFTIPDGTEKISSCMFSGCTSLQKVNIPESVTRIENGAFDFCTGFTEFTVPAQIEYVNGAFEYCDNLKTLIVENPDCMISGDSENSFAMPMNTTIRGYADSKAYWFARYSGRKFEAIYTPGDINNDREANIADAVLLQKWLNNCSTPLYNWQAADLTGDEKVNVFDLIMLKQMISEN